MTRAQRTAPLEGVVLNEHEEPLTSFVMACESLSADEIAPPKF